MVDLGDGAGDRRGVPQPAADEAQAAQDPNICSGSFPAPIFKVVVFPFCSDKTCSKVFQFSFYEASFASNNLLSKVVKRIMASKVQTTIKVMLLRAE